MKYFNPNVRTKTKTFASDIRNKEALLVTEKNTYFVNGWPPV